MVLYHLKLYIDAIWNYLTFEFLRRDTRRNKNNNNKKHTRIIFGEGKLD